MANKKQISAKQACKYLTLDSPYKVPVCSIAPVICSYWFCKGKGFKTFDLKCKLNCFRNCAIKNPNATIITNISDIYDKTINRLDDLINQYKSKMSLTKFYGALISFREHEILLGFYRNPGAFIDVFEINKHINVDLSQLENHDIKIDKDSNYLIHLYSMKLVFTMKLNKSIYNDSIIYCTELGFKELNNLMEDPENDTLLQFAKKGSIPDKNYVAKSECHHRMEFITIQNYDLLKWCRINNFKTEVSAFDDKEIIQKILKHIESTGYSGKLDYRECYNLSFKPYMNAIYGLRNIYTHSRTFLKVAKHYKNKLKSKEYIQWLPVWDNTLFNLYHRDMQDKYSTSKIDIDESPLYRINIKNQTLFPSLILWNFVAKNWEDICSNRWQKGEVFENKIEVELINRDTKILYRNLVLSPDDEIDFLCEKDGNYYMIEAKNYGPVWNYTYLGSSDYKRRIEELNSKLQYAPRRLAILNHNRSKYGIPYNSKIYGIIITSFFEPDIEVPNDFVHITMHQFNKIFGKEKELPGWQKNPIYQVPEEIVNKLHKKYI